MFKKLTIILLLLTVNLLSACSNSLSSDDSYAGILLVNDQEYIWKGDITNNEYTLGEKIGAVTEKVDKDDIPKKNFSSNFLEVGEEIYSSNEDSRVIIVKRADGSLDKLIGKGFYEKETIDNIDAKEVLSLDPSADIFKFNGIIYKTNIDWVDELTLTKKEQIGEIKARNETSTAFSDGMSNKLPVGAKIFSANERGDILIVEIEGKFLKYLAIVEG